MVNALVFTDVEAIKLDLRLFEILIASTLVMIDTKLNGLTPCNSDDRVALVSEGWSQSITPVEIGYSTGLDVRWAPDADQR